MINKIERIHINEIYNEFEKNKRLLLNKFIINKYGVIFYVYKTEGEKIFCIATYPFFKIEFRCFLILATFYYVVSGYRDYDKENTPCVIRLI